MVDVPPDLKTSRLKDWRNMDQMFHEEKLQSAVDDFWLEPGEAAEFCCTDLHVELIFYH